MQIKEYFSYINETSDFIRKHLGNADVAVILGSGLNNFTDEVTSPKVGLLHILSITIIRQELKYDEIPHFPRTTVKGHAGKMVMGNIGDKTVQNLKLQCISLIIVSFTCG